MGDSEHAPQDETPAEQDATATVVVEEKESTGGLLNWVEKVGNKVPNPTIMFCYLIGFIAILSAILSFAGVSVTDTIVTPVPKDEFQALNEHLGGTLSIYDSVTGEPATLPEYTIQEVIVPIRNLLSVPGLRFFFSSFVDNFAGFGVVAVVLISMGGVGVAEHAGMMGALIRRAVKIAPPRWLAFILIFVGVLSSVATDAGYLILVPLAAVAFKTVGRNPLAGLAAAFAAVGGVFGVNLLITPSDSMLTEITNEVITSAGGTALSVTQNYYFSIASSILLAILVTFITTRITEPRLGHWSPADEVITEEEAEVDEVAEARGLKFAGRALLIYVLIIVAMTAPPGAPLRDPLNGNIIGTTPFMASLIFIISLAFLICGMAYGRGARTLMGGNAVVGAIAKTFGSLAGLLVMFLMIAQFIALFNWSNLPTVAAMEAAHALESVNVPAIVLLLGFIVVIFILDWILPGLVPKWVIFAPVFLPIFASLDVAPQTLLAAYRVADSPANIVTPLMVYLPFMVTVAQRYKKDAGIGTIIALMLPYTVWILLGWTVLFAAWFLLGIPWGPGYPVNI